MSNDLWIDEATDTIWRKGRDGKPEYVGTREQVKSQYAEIESPVRIGARALEAGAKRSISDLPGAVGDILSLGAANQPPPIGAGFVPGALDPYKRGAREPSVYPSQVLQSVLNIPEPKGEGERLLTEGVAGAGTGAIAGGLGALTRGAQVAPAVKVGTISGAGAGVGARMAENLAGNIPGAGVVGGMAGGLAAPAAVGAGKIGWTALGGGRSGLPRRVREIASSMSDEQFRRGQENMEAALRARLPITPGQALEEVNPLAGEAARLMRAPGVGPSAQRQLVEQGDLAKQRVQDELSGIAPGFGNLKPEEAVKKAATDALEANTALRTARVQREYAFRVKAIPARDIREFAKQFEEILAKEGATTPAAEEARKMVLGRLALSRQGNMTAWETNPEALSRSLASAKSDIEKSFKSASDPRDTYTASRLKTLVDSFDTYLDKYRVDPARGRQLYQRITKAVVEPGERGLLGQIAGPKGFVEDAPTIASRLNNIFMSEVNVSPNEITQAARAMRRQDATAFPRFVRQLMEQEFERSARSRGGVENTEALGDFIGKVWGSSTQQGKRAHFKTLIAESARSMGKTEPQVREAVQGASGLMEAVAAASRGRGTLASGVSPRAQAGAEGAIADVLRAQGPMMFQSPARRFEFFMEGKLNRQLFDLIFSTDPASMDKLRKLARYDPQTLRNALIASSAVAVEKERD